MRPVHADSGELVLGRYRLRARLGSGGFGEVWSATDELLGRAVAVKRIVGGQADRAAREAQAAARLSHPSIVALYEACSEGDVSYLISELVDGQTLAQLIAQDTLRDDEILRIAIALCDALQHAHDRGVIHRDVKPQNILVPADPADRALAKLTDFGGARLDGEQALTATGDVLGTLPYMAPEQSDGRRAGPEADLYSLALVTYEALTGENPVRGRSAAATVRRIGTALPSLGRDRPDLPRSLVAAIDGALDARPERRGSLQQLAEAMQHASQDMTVVLGGAHDMEATSRTEVRRGAEESEATATLTRPQPGRPAGRRARAALSSAHTAIYARGERERPAAGLAHVEGADEVLLEQAGSARRRSEGILALPKALWLIAMLASIGWAAVSGRAGLALLLLAAALPLLIVMPSRSGLRWLIVALAPALGLSGIASVYPALSGLDRSPRRRLALGALGFWWLCLAQLASSHPLAPAIIPPADLHRGRFLPPPASWESSVPGGAHAIAAMIGVATLAAAAVWGVGSLLAPWLLRRAGLAAGAALAAAWSAAMLIGPGAIAAALGPGSPALVGGSSAARPADLATAPAILGAVAAALIVLAGRALEMRRRRALEPAL